MKAACALVGIVAFLFAVPTSSVLRDSGSVADSKVVSIPEPDDNELVLRRDISEVAAEFTPNTIDKLEDRLSKFLDNPAIGRVLLRLIMQYVGRFSSFEDQILEKLITYFNTNIKDAIRQEAIQRSILMFERLERSDFIKLLSQSDTLKFGKLHFDWLTASENLDMSSENLDMSDQGPVKLYMRFDYMMHPHQFTSEKHWEERIQLLINVHAVEVRRSKGKPVLHEVCSERVVNLNIMRMILAGCGNPVLLIEPQWNGRSLLQAMDLSPEGNSAVVIRELLSHSKNLAGSIAPFLGDDTSSLYAAVKDGDPANLDLALSILFENAQDIQHRETLCKQLLSRAVALFEPDMIRVILKHSTDPNSAAIEVVDLDDATVIKMLLALYEEGVSDEELANRMSPLPDRSKFIVGNVILHEALLYFDKSLLRINQLTLYRTIVIKRFNSLVESRRSAAISSAIDRFTRARSVSLDTRSLLNEHISFLSSCKRNSWCLREPVKYFTGLQNIECPSEELTMFGALNHNIVLATDDEEFKLRRDIGLVITNFVTTTNLIEQGISTALEMDFSAVELQPDFYASLFQIVAQVIHGQSINFVDLLTQVLDSLRRKIVLESLTAMIRELPVTNSDTDCVMSNLSSLNLNAKDRRYTFIHGLTNIFKQALKLKFIDDINLYRQNPAIGRVLLRLFIGSINERVFFRLLDVVNSLEGPIHDASLRFYAVFEQFPEIDFMYRNWLGSPKPIRHDIFRFRDFHNLGPHLTKLIKINDLERARALLYVYAAESAYNKYYHLHVACQMGNPDMIWLLLKQTGSTRTLVDDRWDGKTVLQVLGADQQKSVQISSTSMFAIVQELLLLSGDPVGLVMSCINDENSSLYRAISSGDATIIALYLQVLQSPLDVADGTKLEQFALKHFQPNVIRVIRQHTIRKHILSDDDIVRDDSAIRDSLSLLHHDIEHLPKMIDRISLLADDSKHEVGGVVLHQALLNPTDDAVIKLFNVFDESIRRRAIDDAKDACKQLFSRVFGGLLAIEEDYLLPENLSTFITIDVKKKLQKLLVQAVNKKNVKKVKLSILIGADEIGANFKEPPLHLACRLGNVNTVRQLFQSTYSPKQLANTQSAKEQTALQILDAPSKFPFLLKKLDVGTKNTIADIISHAAGNDQIG